MDRRLPIVATAVLLFAIYCHGKAVRNFYPGYTSEPNYANTMLFKYDHITHLIFTRHNYHYDRCFVYNTTDQDRIDVHTDDGARRVETKVLLSATLKADALSPMSQDELNKIGRVILVFCKDHNVYLLN